MKIATTTFVFDSGATVKFVHGSTEKYEGNVPRFQGKNYAYTVIIENKHRLHTFVTFASPSQKTAKRFLKNSLS